ncbi:MAG: SpoIIE family protein phosphatase [Candidatus Riflebacteria bacterium]
MLEFFRRITGPLARLVFGIVLPVYLVWLLLVSHYSIEHKIEKQAKFDRLETALDHLENFQDDQVFFHALFKINFENLDKNFSREVLEKRINSFKKKFGSKIRFIVYDSTGKIDSELTEETRFKFILKTMFDLIHLVKKAYDQDPLEDPGHVKDILPKLNLVRNYFGRLIFVGEMFEPLKSETRGKCLKSSEDHAKDMLWFYPGINFSLVCLIDKSLSKRGIGPEMILTRFNHGAQSEKLGFVMNLSYDSLGLPEKESLKNQIIVETKNFESNAVSNRESRNFLISFRQITYKMILLSYFDSSLLINPDEKAAGLMLKILRWVLLSIFAVFCLSLRYPQIFISIKRKIVLLLLFANGLPFLILVSTGYEFFNEKKNELITRAHEESLRILREFDLRYPEVTDSIAGELNNYIDVRNLKYGREEWPESDVAGLLQLVKKLAPQESAVLNTRCERVFYYSRTDNVAERLIEDVMQRALFFFNRRKIEQNDLQDSMMTQITSDAETLHFFLRIQDSFSMLGVGNRKRHTFVKLIGDRIQNDIWGVFAASWTRPRLIEAVIQDRLKKSAELIGVRKMMLMENETLAFYSPELSVEPVLRNLLQKTWRQKLIKKENVFINGRPYLFSAIVGNELASSVIAALYPQEIIEHRIKSLKMAVVTVSILTLLVLAYIAGLFSVRLIVPVQMLDQGITRMKLKDYDSRIDYRSEDELGSLVKAFNDTMGNMKELAVGTSVQESLLPPGICRRNSLEIFAKSLYMSKMGGDYFDYFDLPENRMCLFFGDVAGHGIPAAMIMSMAKASITSISKDFAGPGDLLKRLNQIFLHLKKNNWRRMMTAQALDVNCVSGEFIIANAGHCFPYIVSADGTGLRSVKATGMPLGTESKKGYGEITGKLESGETMILYTDGIIEAVDCKQDPFGYERFENLLQNAWTKDLEQYWNNIIDVNRKWAVNQDDDLTFMIIRVKTSV